jgi:vacuolar-type H+-ATPase subunit E/Vma4
MVEEAEHPARRKVDDVAESASDTVNSILDQAYRDSEEIQAAARSRIEKMREEYGRRLYAEIEEIRKGTENSARKQLASEFDAVHAEGLSALKDKFISMVRNIDQETRRRWTSMLIEGAVSDLGVGILHVRKEDEVLAESYQGFEVETDLEASGGIIAEAADGTVLLDYRFESLAESYWSSELSDIMELLFG